MTKRITSKEIQKAYTAKVNEYLAKGMQINTGSMSGSQGEICKIDLTDGSNIYRIRLERDREYLNKDFFYGAFETVDLIIERFENDGRDPLDTWGVLWSGKGELVYTMRWYSIEERKVFTESKEEMIELMNMRTERRKARSTSDNNKIDLQDSKRMKIIVRMVKKQKGYSRISKNDIKSVIVNHYSEGITYMVYFNRESHKRDINIKIAK